MTNDIAPIGMNFDENDMRKDLDWAHKNSTRFAAFRLYSDDQPLYGRKFYSYNDFQAAFERMKLDAIDWYALTHGIKITHVRVYVLDGRTNGARFRAFLWKPNEIGSGTLEPIRHLDEFDPANPYSSIVLRALMRQKGPKKVSTVVNIAWKHFKAEIQGINVTRQYPKLVHLLLLRNALLSLSYSHPCIMRKAGADARGNDTLIEHLGVSGYS